MASFAEAVASIAPPNICAPVDESRGEKIAIAIDLAMLPLRVHTARPMNDEELLHFCGGANSDLRIEREPDGELWIMSPTDGETGNENSSLNAQLYIWARQSKTGKSFDSSTGFTLPDGSIRSPDASWVSLERWNALTPAGRRHFPPVCPEFIVELVSASDPLPEVRRKMAMWLANGTKFAWLIDPGQRVIEVYRANQAEPEVLENPATVAGEGPVAGFVLQLDELWG